MPTQYEWDEAKRETNLAKHGLDFADADLVLESPYRWTVAVVHGTEVRQHSIAYVFERLVVLTLVHTDREGVVRCISFRPASRAERAAYHEWLATYQEIE